MKKITLLLVIIFTFLFSTTSWGEWKFVIKTVESHKFYYDKDRVRKSGKYIYYWELMDLFEPKGEVGSEYSSSMMYKQLDCSIFRYKRLNIIIHKDSMGEGEVVMEWDPEDKWTYPPPDTISDKIHYKICEEQQ